MPGYSNQQSMNGPSQMGGNQMYGGGMNRGMPGSNYPSQYGPQGGMGMSGQYGQYQGQNSMGPGATGKMPPGGPNMPPNHPPSSMMSSSQNSNVSHSSSVGSSSMPNPNMMSSMGPSSNSTSSSSSFGSQSHGITPNTSVSQGSTGGSNSGVSSAGNGSVSKSSPVQPTAPPSQNSNMRLPGAPEGQGTGIPKGAQAAAQAAMMAAKNQSQHSNRTGFEGGQPVVSTAPTSQPSNQPGMPTRGVAPPQGSMNPMMGQSGMDNSGPIQQQMGGYNTGGPPSQGMGNNSEMTGTNSNNSSGGNYNMSSSANTNIPPGHIPANMVGNSSYGMPAMGHGPPSMNGVPSQMSRNIQLPPNAVAPPANGPLSNSMPTSMGPPMGHHPMGPPHSIPPNSGHFMKPPDMAGHMDGSRGVEDIKPDNKLLTGMGMPHSVSGMQIFVHVVKT